MATLTADGSTVPVKGPEVTFLFSGSLGGGTLTLERLIDGGDPADDADWRLLIDGTTTATYTASPGGQTVSVASSMLVRGTLTGSTSPDLEYSLHNISN